GVLSIEYWDVRKIRQSTATVRRLVTGLYEVLDFVQQLMTPAVGLPERYYQKIPKCVRTRKSVFKIRTGQNSSLIIHNSSFIIHSPDCTLPTCTSLLIFFTKPWSTFPGPHSKNWEAPSPIMCWTDWLHRTGAVSWAMRLVLISSRSVTPEAFTFW